MLFEAVGVLCQHFTDMLRKTYFYHMRGAIKSAHIKSGVMFVLAKLMEKLFLFNIKNSEKAALFIQVLFYF